MPETADAALARVYDDALAVLEAAHVATLHPLGFLILAQMPDGNGGYSRLHLWERVRLRPEIPHSHSGDLHSSILAGTLANTMWRPTKTHGTPVAMVAVRKDSRSARRYEPLGTGAIAPKSREIYATGQSYFIAAGAFHSSECLSDFAVTFVRRSPSLTEPSHIAVPEEFLLERRRRIVVPTGLRAAAITLLAAERRRMGRD